MNIYSVNIDKIIENYFSQIQKLKDFICAWTNLSDVG